MPCSEKSNFRRTRSRVRGLNRIALRWLCVAVLAAPLVRGAEENWSKVTTDHFVLLTPAGEATARRWAIEFEQFRRGLQQAMPVPVERLRPVTIVLFQQDRAMQPYLPLEKGKPARMGGFFVRANDINTIMLSLARDAEETRRVIFHEAVHWHLSAREGFLPLWLGEGLAEVYATFAVPDAHTYAFGAAIDDHVRRLQRESLLPLSRLMGLGRDSLLYNEGTRASIFYAQAWAFVHFLHFGEKSPGRAAVQRYLDLLPVVRSADDAFFSAFGADYQEVERQFRAYIGSGRGSYRKHVYPRNTDDIARRLAFGPATPADIELARGSLLLGARSAEEAEPHLGRAAGLAPADPRPWELLGHVAVGRRDFSTALVLLDRAIAVGSTSYLVRHNVAVARLRDSSEPWQAEIGVEPRVMDAAAEDFRAAIRLAPGHLPAYEGLAGLVRGMATFRPEDQDLLARGLALSPGNIMIEAGLAAAESRVGRPVEARARLERLCSRYPSDAGPAISYARRLLEAERVQAETAEITRLTGEGRLDEVIAIAERALARSIDAPARTYMENVKRRMHDYLIVREAVDLANAGEAEAAKGRLDALLASQPEIVVQQEARRVLYEVARRQGAAGRSTVP